MDVPNPRLSTHGSFATCCNHKQSLKEHPEITSTGRIACALTPRASVPPQSPTSFGHSPRGTQLSSQATSNRWLSTSSTPNRIR